MFQSWDNTRELTRTSWNVLRHNPTLMIFPFLGMASAILLMVPFFHLTDLAQQNSIPSVGRLFLLYMAAWFLILFFNCCIAACSMMAFNGAKPDAWCGIKMAFNRLPQILLWSLFSSTIGALLHVLEGQAHNGRSTFGALAGIMYSLVGVAWRWGSLLILPVIIIEGQYPLTAFGTSASLFRNTWGEEFFGEIRVNFPILIPAFLCGAAIVMSMSVPKPWAIPLFFAGLAGFAILIIMKSVVSIIFKVALYYFATQKKLPVT